MRLRRKTRAGRRPISLQTTAMIDIVFLLLVFFILTFQIVAAEGDFNLAMPKQSVAGPPRLEDLPITLTVKLEADDSGDLSRLSIDGKLLEATDGATAFAALHDYIRQLVGPNAEASGNFEVELQCDAKLKYKYLIEALTAVSGYRVRSGDDDRIVRLIKAIRFAK
jgi:biopolymer transport protein ExbD